MKAMTRLNLWIIIVLFTRLAIMEGYSAGCVPPPAGLVGWWAADSSPADNAGTNNAITSGIEYESGKVGMAFVLSGNGDTITVPAHSNLNVTSLTIEGWFFPSNMTTAQPLFEFSQLGSYGLNFWINMDLSGDINQPVPGGLLANLQPASGGSWKLIASPAGSVIANQWQHIALTYDRASGISRIYVNGAKVAEENLGQFTPWTSLPINIGCRQQYFGFNGKIDEISLYNRALTTNEIQALVSAGAAGKCGPLSPPVIASSPTNIVVGVNRPVTLQPVVSGNSPLYFRWFLNGTNLIGATNQQLTIPAATLDQAGEYSLAVSNAFGSITGLIATLAVQWPPIITSPPTNLTVKNGDPITIQADATGSPPLFFQWRLNGSKWDGATNQQLVIPAVSLANEGEYSLIVSNAVGTATGNIATLMVQTPPMISSSITEVTVYVGQPVAVRVSVAGSPPFAYQWQLNGAILPGAVNQELLIARATFADAGEYSVIVTNPFGVITGIVANLSVKAITCVSPPNDIVAWWPAETTGMDFVGTNNASISGVTFVHGKVGQAFGFNGSNSMVTIPASSNLNVKSFTFEGWIFPQDFTRAQPLIEYANGYGLNFWLNVDCSGNVNAPVTGALSANIVDTSNGWHIMCTPAGAVPSNQWSHVALTYDQSSGIGKIFVNGSMVSSNNLGIFTPRTTGALNLGNRSVYALFIGLMDEFSLYRRALISDEVQAIVAADIAGKCGPQVPPALVHSPTNLVFGLGEPFTLQAVVAGTPPFSYQWLFNGTNLDGANSQPLVIPAATMADAGEYSLFVSNAFGTATGVVANVSVLILPPAIVTQPVSQTVLAGSNAMFNVVASGTPPKTYQWYFNTTPLADATNATLALPAVTQANAGQYWVTVENTEGSATSAVATLTIQLPPAKVLVTSPTVSSGLPAAVPVLLVANGNESALQFSIYYTASKVSLLDVTVSGVATNAALFINSSQLSNGHVGVILALPTGQTFPAGTQEVVHLNFLPVLTTNATTMVLGFSDIPTARQLVDAQAQVLAANYNIALLTILPAVYEADVAPRGAPDRIISVADLVQIGRFVAGLDAITNAAEFQRADCAPRSDGGNGVLSVTDWVQAGRYAAAIDYLQVASGPTEPITEPGLVRASRQPYNSDGNACAVTLADTSLTLGQTNRLAVVLTADGTACAIGFTLNYDPNQLTFVGGALAQGGDGAQVIFNTSKTDAGQLGVAAVLPAGNNFAVGLQQVVYLDFVVAATVRSSVSLSFGDTTVKREVSDTQANALAATWTGKSLAVILPPLQISMAAAGKTLKFSWPEAVGNTVLEVSDSLTAPNWTPVQLTPTSVDGNNQLTIPVDGQQRFYRLKTQ